MNRRLILCAALTTVAYAGVSALPVAAFALAEKDKHEHKEGEKHAQAEEHKGEKKMLGKQNIAGYEVQVAQVGEVVPGKEAVFVVMLKGGSGKPKAVRGWIGVETGKGAIKSKAEDEKTEYHLHHEVAKPLPPKNKLWLELETATGKKLGSFDYSPLGRKKDDHKDH